MLGLCLMGVFLAVAIVATSASALPEFGKCIAKAGGKFVDSNCTKKASLKNPGSFEWKKGSEEPNVHFTGGNVGSGGVLTALYRTCTNEAESEVKGRVTRKKCEELGGKEGKISSPINVECESEANNGETHSTKSVVNISVRFKGCKTGGTIPCSNGPNEGEIDVNALKGTLGYINKAEHRVGVVLEPLAKKGEFAKFNCAGTLEIVVGVGNATEGAAYLPETTGGYDGIISPITPINQMTTEETQVFTVNKETAANIPSKFEGKHIDLLESYLFLSENPATSSEWSPAGEEITNVNHAAEEGEIKG
jgi:hypothetical protein